MKVFEKVISPEEAKKFLEKTNLNRKVSQKNVDYLYSQMLSGNWMLTGDSIKFGSDGSLLDGQHRLSAIIKYGKPVATMVIEGLDPKVFTVLDTGKNRSAADVLSAAGINYSHNLAAISRAIILWNEGSYNKDAGAGRHRGVTNKRILEFVESNPELAEICKFCESTVYRNFRMLPLSTLGMLYYVLSKKNQTKCDEFFGKYATGIDLSETNPIRHLRERLLKDRMNKTRLTLRDKTALTIYTWNNFIQGKRITQLLLPKNYTFPKPI